MKSKFFGYIPYEGEIFEDLWENAVFVVDANILLNLYRYSEDTQKEVINVLKLVKNRVWIPYNTANEFFNNRVKVIINQDGMHNSLKAELSFNKFRGVVDEFRHITLGLKKKEMKDILDECEKKLFEIIERDKESTQDIIENDYVLKEIIELFDNRVGEDIREERLNILIKEIDERYEKQIPPGYKDAKKQKEGRKYGDCLNWFEIIEYSKSNSKNVIYITDDNKDDWMVNYSGRNLGPRRELLDEFYRKTEGNIIYIYNTEGFLENSKKYINNNNISDTTIDEVKSLNKLQEMEEYEYASNVVKELYDEYNKFVFMKKIKELNSDGEYGNEEKIGKNDDYYKRCSANEFTKYNYSAIPNFNDIKTIYSDANKVVYNSDNVDKNDKNYKLNYYEIIKSTISALENEVRINNMNMNDEATRKNIIDGITKVKNIKKFLLSNEINNISRSTHVRMLQRLERIEEDLELMLA